MPIRAYEPLESPCRLCGAGFEVIQGTHEPPLATCPRCGQAVRLRAAAPVSSPRLLKPVSPAEARSAGFTVLKRTPGGEFEKQ